MPFRIAQLPADDKFSQQFSLSLLEEIYPREVIAELLSQLQRWEQRERKLSQLVMVYLLLAWHLFCRESLRAVFLHLSAALRLCGLLSATAVPTKNAFFKRRKQLGVRFFRLLLRRVCQPRATVETPGAFAFGFRLVAIDGTLEDVADSPANAHFFGRLSRGPTASPYPQARCLYLVEVATHLIFDAIIAPCRASEQRLCWGLLRSISADMLVLLDRGFVSGPFFEAIRTRGAHVLARLSQDLFLRHTQDLADGSYLTWMTPHSCHGLTEPMLVRVIEYFIKPEVTAVLVKQPPSRLHSHADGTNPAIAKRHRLITTLLDPRQAPALDLCLLYHERWEIELSIDESKNHLRISQSPLLSRLPLLALQELYVILLTHYALRAIMLQAAQAHDHLDPDRLSFILTVQTLRDVVILASHPSRPPMEQVACQVQATLLMPGSLLAPRRLRFNCRVVKHICTRFRRKRPEHVNLSLKHTRFADILLM
jgi:hypothetical protein